MNRKLALISLGIGTLLFALAPPVLKLLTSMGGRLGLHLPGAISYCNVLFVGNLCAGLIVIGYHGPRRTIRELVSLKGRTKLMLLLGAGISTLYPALLFTGLERTSVINVVLLSRFNGIIFVVLAYVMLGAAIRRFEAIGYTVMALGVIGLVVVTNGGLNISSGELFVLASTVFFALTEVISKVVLKDCSIHTYVFFRNAVSAILFFSIGMYLFGPGHFSEAFTGELWVLMLVYSGIAVVAAQVFWMTGARSLPPQAAANFQLVSPAFTILFAFLLLSEVPGLGEWVVMGIILSGMLISRLSGRVMAMSPESALAGR